MKKLNLLALILFISFQGFAQSEDLSKILSSVLTQMENAESKEDMQNTINILERISTAESDEWLPSYYASYGNAMISFMEKDVSKKKAYNQNATDWHKQAVGNRGDETELLILEGLIYQAMIQIDPMTMGPQYGPKSVAVLSQAAAKDPGNPRADMLLGQNLYYTPEMFGGGAEKACPLIESAAEKFKTFKAKSELHPNWGEDRVLQLQEMCKPKKEDD